MPEGGHLVAGNSPSELAYLSRVIPASSPDEADKRLEALLAHRKALEEEPNWRDTPAGGPNFLERMGPLLLSQGLDYLTTEQAMQQPGISEGNPMPGFGNPLGRLGGQILQSILFDQIYKRHPDVGRNVIDFGTILHSGAALGNAKTTEDQRYLNLYR